MNLVGCFVVALFHNWGKLENSPGRQLALILLLVVLYGTDNSCVEKNRTLLNQLGC